jgi:hypothetical protein
VVLCNRSFVLQPNTQIISVQDHSLKQQALCPLVHSMILALTVASEVTLMIKLDPKFGYPHLLLHMVSGGGTNSRCKKLAGCLTLST